MPSRRQVLAACATGLAGALAGCVDPDVAMFVERLPNDREIAEQATVASTGQPDASHADLVADAVAGGTEVAAERPPYEPDRPVRHDGAVYELRWASVDSGTRTEYAISGRVRPESDLEPEIDIDELPEPDRRALEELDLPRPEQLEDEIRLERRFHYDEADRERSVLVPQQEYEVVGIEGAPVTVETTPVTVERHVFAYEAERLADSLSAFGERVREAHLFELDGLDAEARAFFEDVVEEGSYYDASPGEPFERVADRIVTEPAILVEDREGEWLLAYDGESHWVRIDFVRMREYANRLTQAESPVAVDGAESG